MSSKPVSKPAPRRPSSGRQSVSLAPDLVEKLRKTQATVEGKSGFKPSIAQLVRKAIKAL